MIRGSLKKNRTVKGAEEEEKCTCNFEEQDQSVASFVRTSTKSVCTYTQYFCIFVMNISSKFLKFTNLIKYPELNWIMDITHS